MLSLAMIRVEPGSTPGIGITIIEISFLGFFVFCGMFFCFLLFRLCAMFFAFRKGNSSHVILAAAAVLEIFFDIATYLTLLQILGFGDYILHHQVRQSR